MKRDNSQRFFVGWLQVAPMVASSCAGSGFLAGINPSGSDSPQLAAEQGPGLALGFIPLIYYGIENKFMVNCKAGYICNYGNRFSFMENCQR
jgi:hypothetical protein